MKKVSFKGKNPEELMTELKKLQAFVATASFGRTLGKQGDLKEYRVSKKNIARIFTALNTK